MPGTSDPELEAARMAARRRFAHLAGAAETDVEAVTEASVVADDDNPVLSDAKLRALRPASDVHPRLVTASLARRAGKPERRSAKRAASMRLDADIVDALKAPGDGWQMRANALLRAALNLEI